VIVLNLAFFLFKKALNLFFFSHFLDKQIITLYGHFVFLKGLSHEIDFKNVDKKLQN
jgi:hypothetical protein